MGRDHQMLINKEIHKAMVYNKTMLKDKATLKDNICNIKISNIAKIFMLPTQMMTITMMMIGKNQVEAAMVL